MDFYVILKSLELVCSMTSSRAAVVAFLGSLGDGGLQASLLVYFLFNNQEISISLIDDGAPYDFEVEKKNKWIPGMKPICTDYHPKAGWRKLLTLV